MARDEDRDTLVVPPGEPEPPESPMFRKFHEAYEREMRERQAAEAKQKAAYEKRTRNFNISESAAVGGDPYPEED